MAAAEWDLQDSLVSDAEARQARVDALRIKFRVRIAFYAIASAAVICVSQLGLLGSSNNKMQQQQSYNAYNNPMDVFIERRALGGTTTSDCQDDADMLAFCTVNGTFVCTGSSEYTMVCCRNDNECRTYEDDICAESEICNAELKPAGNGYGECMEYWETHGGTAAYIIIMFYLFFGLGLVCDGYFVASLERISVALKLPEDVAGATFLAAGSSSPELFVALSDNVISNPPKNVGVGTIVGSAIFNICMIIGLSALLARETLQLDWRPILRDVFFYVVSIIALILVILDSEAQWYEGLIFLVIYAFYVATMALNRQVLAWMDRTFTFGIKRPADSSIVSSSAEDDAETEANKNAEDAEAAITPMERSQHRAVFQEAAEAAHTPKNRALHRDVASSAARAARNDLGSSYDGSIRFAADEESYNALFLSRNRAFNNNRHSIRRRESAKRSKMTSKLTSIGPNPYGGDPSLTHHNSMNSHASNVVDGSGRSKSIVSENPLRTSEPREHSSMSETSSTKEGYWDVLKWPTVEDDDGELNCFQRYCCGGCRLWLSRVYFIIAFPYQFLFRITIPDCAFDVFHEDKAGQPENRRIAYTSAFACAVIWVAALSYVLSWSAQKFGCTVGISSSAMGLTFLAAGTSFPDCISSIIVARQGQGSMAVANSIGSNNFDILVGLGIPWFLAGLIYKTPSGVDTSDVTTGVSFMFAVLVVLLIVLRITRWKLNKFLGSILVVLYILYFIFELAIYPLI